MAPSNRDKAMDEEQYDDADIVILTDETGQSLECYIEHSLDVEGEDYVLLLPVDATIEIVSWEETEGEEEEAVLVDDPEEITQIFATAKAVLSEQNLGLKRTAVVLTVDGELPELNEEDEAEDSEDGEDEEELQLLASFYHEEQEYSVYAHLDPYYILARLDEKGNPILLSPEELKRIEPLLPMIEDQLFDALD